MNGEGNREWKHGTYTSRVEAHIVETRDDEPRKMDLLFIVARCLRSPEIGAVFVIFKLSVDELRLVDTRADELRGESRMEARDL